MSMCMFMYVHGEIHENDTYFVHVQAHIHVTVNVRVDVHEDGHKRVTV